MSEGTTRGLMRYVAQADVRSHPQDQHGRGTPADAHGVAWLDWLLRHRERSAKTIEAYETTLHVWLGHCDEHGVDPLRPCLEDPESFTVRPKRNGGVRSTSTRRQKITALGGFFEHLCQRGVVVANPAADLVAPRAKCRHARPMPDGDWLTLWRAAHGERHEGAQLLTLCLGLGFYCGLRRQEMAELRGDQITDELIVRFVRKGGDEHTLPWLEMVEHHAEHPALRHLLPEPERFVDGLLEQARRCGSRPLLWTTGKTVHSKMVALCARAGVPAFTPHRRASAPSTSGTSRRTARQSVTAPRWPRA
jgi:integrase